jgi:uncharacterized Rmd1/YagE family protein
MQMEMTATCISEKIRTKSIELGQRMSYLPLSFYLGENQWIVIFRFGVIVTIGLNEKEFQDILQELQEYLDSPLTTPISESISITLGSAENIIESG